MHSTTKKGRFVMERRLWTGGRRLLVSLALAAMIVPMVLAACGGEERKQVPDALGTKLQQILDSAVASRDTVIPGTALYVSQPDLGRWTGAAGKADVDASTPMRADDTFSPGSIMKPLVATVVLQLAEEGKLGLDDRLPEVLPRDVVAGIADADRITVRMLLDHTSGVPEYDDTRFDRMVLADPHRIWTVDELLDRSASRPRPFEPGKGYAYSNTDYNLLGIGADPTTGALLPFENQTFGNYSQTVFGARTIRAWLKNQF